MSFKEKYWKYTLIAILLVIGIVLFYEFKPFMGGFLGALTIYILLRHQLFYLTEKKRWRPTLASALLLVETALIFLVPFSFAVWLMVKEIQGVNLDTQTLVGQVEHIAELIRQKTSYDLLDQDNVAAILGFLPKIGQYLMSGISGFAINIMVLLMILYFMLIGGRRMEKYLYEILPFSDHNKQEVLREMNMLVKANALGVPLIALVQGVVGFIGYLLFDVANPVVFGFMTAFLSIIPIVGSGLIWVPMVLYFVVTGDWFNAIGLAAYCLLILGNVDNLARFLLQRKLADTHPLVTIFGVIIGLSLFGFMGIIFGPILLAGFLLCFNIFKTEYLEGKP